MPKLKKKLTENFTIINNTVLRDKRMGCTERGAYVTLVSMADDWNFSIRGLAVVVLLTSVADLTRSQFGVMGLTTRTLQPPFTSSRSSSETSVSTSFCILS